MRELQEKVERERAAKEQLTTLREQLSNRRRFLFHGGFSQKPLEHYNRVEQGIRHQVEALQAEARRQALSAAQRDKIQEIYDKIEDLHEKVRSDVKTIRRDAGDDNSDVGSVRSAATRRMSVKSKRGGKRKQRD